MTVIKALFFDLDGTLVDTHEANYRAYKDAIRSVTGSEPDESLRTHIADGLSSKEFIPLVVNGASDEQVTAINAHKGKGYKSHLEHTTLNEYLAAFLRQLSPEVTTALVTTAKRHNGEAVLRAHGLSEVFDFCVFGDDVAAMKPDPEAYLLALEKAGVAADEVIAFEDSAKGIEAAEAAGIPVIHVKDFVA